MATLIAVYKSGGDKGAICVGRCDAKCYEATSAVCDCDCICGGMNHGGGDKRAVANTQKYCDEMIEQWKKKHNDSEHTFEITQNVSQFKLF